MPGPSDIDKVPLDELRYQKTLKKLRNLWQLPYIIEFITIFRKLFHIKIGDVSNASEIFEEDLLGINEPPILLDKITNGVVSFLVKNCTGNMDEDFRRALEFYGQNNYLEESIVRRMEKCCAVKRTTKSRDPNDFTWCEGIKFSMLDADLRVICLGLFIKWITTFEEFREKLDASALDKPPDDLRTLPIYSEDEGVAFFLFGPRLYCARDEENVQAVDGQKREKKINEKGRLTREIDLMENIKLEQSNGKGNGNQSRNDSTGRKKRNRNSAAPLHNALDDLFNENRSSLQWSCVCWNQKSWDEFQKRLKSRKSKTNFKKYISQVNQNLGSAKTAAISRQKARQKAEKKAILMANRKRSLRQASKTNSPQLT